MRDFYIAPQHHIRLLGLSLLAQYGVVLSPSMLFAQVLFIVHIVLLLLWQNSHCLSCWHKYRISKLWSLLLILALFISFIPYLIGIWQLLLLSLLAGRALYTPKDRWLNFVALLFLSVNLFALVLPSLLLQLSDPFFAAHFYLPPPMFIYGLLILPLGYLLIEDKAELEIEKFDFFHGLSLSLAYLSLVFSSLFLLQSGLIDNYPVALLLGLLGLICFLLCLSLLWVALGKDVDISQLWARHWQSMDSVFEQWLAGLTQPNNYKMLDSNVLIESSFKQLLSIPWICGIEWQASYAEGRLGDQSRHSLVVIVQSLEVTFFTWQKLSSTYGAHIRLLVQLLEHFHQSKQREEDYAQQAHLKAIHETGAKLTHDIKNLLQSLYVITSAIETVQPAQFGDTHRLLQGQLPHLSQRLKLTLDKLQQPVQASYNQISIRTWWDNLRARYHKRAIIFSANIVWNAQIPDDLFDNVVENLLENALNKRKRETDLQIYVTLLCTQNETQLTVCDDGSPVASNIERQLLSQPVASRDGFGIGLYHAAKQTFHSPYQLQLSHNQTGKVCFELKGIEKK